MLSEPRLSLCAERIVLARWIVATSVSGKQGFSRNASHPAASARSWSAANVEAVKTMMGFRFVSIVLAETPHEFNPIEGAKTAGF